MAEGERGRDITAWWLLVDRVLSHGTWPGLAAIAMLSGFASRGVDFLIALIGLGRYDLWIFFFILVLGALLAAMGLRRSAAAKELLEMNRELVQYNRQLLDRISADPDKAPVLIEAKEADKQ